MDNNDSDKELSLISPWQTTAIKCLVLEGKTHKETSAYLKSQGYDIETEAVKRFSKALSKSVVEEEQLNIAKQYLLNSIDRVAADFEEINQKTKKLLEKYESEGNDYMQMIVIKELREQIKIALVKLGEYKSTIVGINNVNVISSQDIVDKFRKMQFTYFDTMDATLEDNRLVYRKPSIELVDSYNRYKAIRDGVIKSSDSVEVPIQSA
jgi:ABC-type phosphate transport system auxiliary subunit